VSSPVQQITGNRKHTDGVTEGVGLAEVAPVLVALPADVIGALELRPVGRAEGRLVVRCWVVAAGAVEIPGTTETFGLDRAESPGKCCRPPSQPARAPAPTSKTIAAVTAQNTKVRGFTTLPRRRQDMTNSRNIFYVISAKLQNLLVTSSPGVFT
jgi:hypothetical protein